MGLTWAAWASVSEGSSTPGGPVTAIPWGNNIALFLADPNGGIYTALGDRNYEADHGNFADFGPWRSVSEGGSKPGGRVTAIPWGNNIALFLADPNGGIYTALGDPNYAADHGNFAGFGPWRSVSEGGSKPGGPVTAIPWGNNIALFLADPNGGIYTALGDPNYAADHGNFAGFGPWRSVSEGSSTPGGPVTAIPWGNNIALFLADPNGGIYTALGDPNYAADHGNFAGFGPWRSVSEGGSTPGGRVTAIPWGNNIALFLADPNGGIYTALGDPNYAADHGNFAGFGPWRSVSEGGSTPGGPVTAIPWGNNIALFLADPNGGIYTALGDPNYAADHGNFAGFGPWTSVAEGTSAPGAPITITQMETRLALFMTDHTGEVYATCTVPMLRKIEIEFHTQDDDLNHDTLLNIFVKNRSNTSSTPEEATDYIGNYLSYQEHDANWSDKNPYLGFAQNASKGQTFNDHSTNTVDIPLRSKPIPPEEIVLPVVNIHILAERSDHWVFDYTITFTFDDGAQFSFSSKVNGVDSIVLDQDNRNYSGICKELRALPPPSKPNTDAVLLTRVLIEFHTHNDNKNADTQVNIHVVNRLSDSSSRDISVALNVLRGQEFEDSDDPEKVKRVSLPLTTTPILLQDMVLPVVFINIAQEDKDQWIFDYRVTYFFGDTDLYSSTTSGVVLDKDHHKHMGVYNGRPFPTVAYPKANLTPFAIDHAFQPKSISLSFLQKKLDELLNSRQGVGSQDQPLMKLHIDNTGNFGHQLPESYVDLQTIRADPPGVAYNNNPMDLRQQFFAYQLAGVYFNDINSKSLTLNVNPGNVQAPLTLDLQFETEGPEEVDGSADMDIVKFEIRVLLTLRFDEDNHRVDLMGWVDDISKLKYTSGSSQVTGTFMGNPIDSASPAGLQAFIDQLVDQVMLVDLKTSEPGDPGGTLRQKVRDALYDKLTKVDPITQISMRDSLNATVNSWLMGEVIASGNPAPLAFSNPCRLVAATVKDDNLTLNYIGPEKSFVYQAPPDWPAGVDFSPGTLANIDHIIVLTQENRSFDHMLGYLSLPFEKGGMNRQDVDGLKGGMFNMFNGKRYESFRFAAGDTIFSPGPPNSTERVLEAINNGKMDGFVQSQADECGPDTAHRVMGYHTADNVPTYDALARDFAICHRWFAPHPGPTFPNRYYELTGRPNIDPWGVWEYSNSSPLRAVFTDTIFDHLTKAEVSWRYFEHGYCFLRFFERHTFDSTNVVSFDDPVAGFERLARSGNLPSVSFIDPHFVDYPPNSACDEPPSDIKNGQAFIKSLVEILVSSPKWNKTLLIITYDEHGGFYDHVPTVPAVPVSAELFATTGARVPAFVISPWVKDGAVFGTPAVHFDHTSILKTIAKRFMSSNPPYMGSRYAAAHDLSEILETQIRPGPFRPFIPYTLVCEASQMCLDVQNASLFIGAPICQLTPNATDEAQNFRFEDAGNGFFYIRTLAGLYVTADAPTGPGGTIAIKQDRKYAPGSVGLNNPDLQRWRFASSAVVATHPDDYAISCAAVPGKVLQPANGSTASGEGVVLGDPPHINSQLIIPNPWKVTSPLLPLESFS